MDVGVRVVGGWRWTVWRVGFKVVVVAFWDGIALSFSEL